MQVCLEILHFSNYSGDAENSVMRETWTRLLDQALAVGGVGEACSVLRRVGPLLYPGDGGSMPLHTICLHLETAAHVRCGSTCESLEYFVAWIVVWRRIACGVVVGRSVVLAPWMYVSCTVV